MKKNKAERTPRDRNEKRRLLLSKNNELSYTFDNDKLPEGNASVQANGVGVMAKLGALTRKQLRAVIAVIVALAVVVPSLVFVGLRAKADSGNGIQKDAEGLTTVKTVSDTPDEDGNYTVTIEAYNTQYELTTYPTDTVLVLERSTEMEKGLYEREITNLQTYTSFKKISNPTHNNFYEGNNNPDSVTGVALSNDYQGNKYIKDPNNPNVYVYLCQTYDRQWKLPGAYYNEYSYTIMDSEGNVYVSDSDLTTDELDDYEQWLGTTLFSGIGSLFNISSLNFRFKCDKNGSTTRPENAVEMFSVSDFYQRDRDTATNAELFEYANTTGLFIYDDGGNQRQVFMEPVYDNSGNRIIAYRYYINDDNGNVEYETFQGNSVYGADFGVFQGFKSYIQKRNSSNQLLYLDSNGNETTESAKKEYRTSWGQTYLYSVTPNTPILFIDHENSIERKSLYTNQPETVTRLLAMKEAVEEFLIKVHISEYKNGNDNSHRIGIVSYASKTEPLDRSAESSIDYELTPVYDEGIVMDMIAKVYSYKANGRRRIDVGMEYAHTVLNNRNDSTTKTTHNVNVIPFSAGVPSSSTSNSYELDKADNALAERKLIENEYAKAKMYTVGLFENANENELYGKYFYRFTHNPVICDGTVGKYWGGTYLSGLTNSEMSPTDAAAMNRFMNYLSSNYSSSSFGTRKSAAGVLGIGRYRANNIGLNDQLYFGQQYLKPGFWSTGGYGYKITKPTVDKVADNYYYATHDAQELSNAFSQIAEQVAIPTSILDEGTTINDYVTEYFQNPTNVQAYTMKYTGSTFGQDALNNPENWTETGGSYPATVKGKTISVTGFNYADHYVASDNDADMRQKMVITFKIKPIENFQGGNYVPTNEQQSGISDQTQSFVENFPIPHVNIKPNASITTKDLDVYYSREADLFSMFTNIANVDGTNNALVDIQYVLIDPDVENTEDEPYKNRVFTYTIYAGDTTGGFDISGEDTLKRYPELDNSKKYKLQCIITPIDMTHGGYSAQESEVHENWVYIYKPTFTEKDEEYSYSRAQNPGANVVPEIEWSVVKEDNEKYVMSDNAPSISYTVVDKTNFSSDTAVPKNQESGYPIPDDTNFQVINVVIPIQDEEENRSFTYDTYYEFYVLEDGTVSDVRVTETSTPPANAAKQMVLNDNNELEEAKDENNNPIYVTKAVLVHETKAYDEHVNNDEDFTTFVTIDLNNQIDTTRRDGRFTKYVGATYNLTVQKKYVGDYANPEKTTIVVADNDAFSETVTFDPTITGDFDKLVSKEETIQNLSGGVVYSITELEPVNTNGQYNVSVKVMATPVNGTATEVSVSETNGVFTFTAPDQDLDSITLVVTNEDTTTYVATGVSEDTHSSNILLIALAASAAVSAGGYGVYRVFRSRKEEN